MLKPAVSALVALWPVALAAAVAALAERYWPWRNQLTDWLRWLHASVLFALGSLMSELALPIGLTGVALFAAERHWGLLDYLRTRHSRHRFHTMGLPLDHAPLTMGVAYSPRAS